MTDSGGQAFRTWGPSPRGPSGNSVLEKPKEPLLAVTAGGVSTAPAAPAPGRICRWPRAPRCWGPGVGAPPPGGGRSPLVWRGALTESRASAECFQSPSLSMSDRRAPPGCHHYRVGASLPVAWLLPSPGSWGAHAPQLRGRVCRWGQPGPFCGERSPGQHRSALGDTPRAVLPGSTPLTSPGTPLSRAREPVSSLSGLQLASYLDPQRPPAPDFQAEAMVERVEALG